MIGIYCVLNKVNGKRYIGQSVDVEGRLFEHRTGFESSYRHSNRILQNAIKKYGVENFEFFVLEETPRETLDEREMYWISYYDSFNREYGYNLTRGGKGSAGLKPSAEVLSKLSAAQKRLWSTDAHRLYMSKARTGHYVSEETRSKIGAKSKERMSLQENKEALRQRTLGTDYWCGKVYVYKIVDGYLMNQRIPHEDVLQLLSEGWSRGRGPDNIPRKL